jgi:hypothetical protein
MYMLACAHVQAGGCIHRYMLLGAGAYMYTHTRICTPGWWWEEPLGLDLSLKVCYSLVILYFRPGIVKVMTLVFSSLGWYSLLPAGIVLPLGVILSLVWYCPYVWYMYLACMLCMSMWAHMCAGWYVTWIPICTRTCIYTYVKSAWCLGIRCYCLLLFCVLFVFLSLSPFGD